MSTDELIVEARAKIIWGDEPASVRYFLTSNGMSSTDANAKVQEPIAERTAEVPVALLSEALLELRQARGDSKATREAAIRYFKQGIAKGFQVGPLLQWLLFWPSNSESVFWQVRFPGNEGSQFIEMLKKLSLQDLGFTPEEEQALLKQARSQSGAEPCS